MGKFLKAVNHFTSIVKYLGLITIGFMMFFIACSVIFRRFGFPILGSVELIQLMMVVTIVCSLSYSESQDAHIKVDLLYDKFPRIIQKILTIVTRVVSILVTLLIAYVYYQVFVRSVTENSLTTDLLGIPFSPFELMIALGFTAWFLQHVALFYIEITTKDMKTNYIQEEGKNVS